MIDVGDNGAPSVCKPILERLAGRPGPPPVWLMRQAGRYLPEYREIRRAAGSFLELCYTPSLAMEVTLQPIRRFGFDAAILFSDILVVPDALGQEVRFVEGEGPQLTPIRDRQAAQRLDSSRVRCHLAPVFETVRRVRAALPAPVTLMGFAGAPWTIVAYMIEGASSRESQSFATARGFVREQPGLVLELIDLVTEVTVDYLAAQIEAGAEAVQLFDSWAGALEPTALDALCIQPARRIVTALGERHPGVPVILFPRGVGGELSRFARLGQAAISLDTATPMAWAVEALPDVACLQGNLDPELLVGSVDTMLESARKIVRATRGRAHIFNLGHGILPTTPPQNVAALVADLKSAAA
jgi:uroporphyrinogen decarboxylase